MAYEAWSVVKGWVLVAQLLLVRVLLRSYPVKRELFSNKDFRIDFSHALDRQEMIDLVTVSQG